MVRSQKEVEELYTKERDLALNKKNPLWWEFRGKIILSYCSFEFIKGIARSDISDADIKKNLNELSREYILKEMKEYFDFAWEKATNARGISASRSIEHYKIWIWLLGDDEFLDWIIENEDDLYNPYGIRILEKIKERYAKEWEKL